MVHRFLAWHGFIRRHRARMRRHTEGHLKANTLTLAVAISASVTLTGCGQVKKLMGGKPSGQVVATVNGEEITQSELKAELRGFASADPKIMKQAEQAGLRQIIIRDLLVQKAKEAKL